mmetsp:Transcript_39254/g.82540  ORF Transcript_39254/g.82540 Transcript_39254/m.82540 type:complete len:470 (-) Transcript_39254:64-1473(-)
MRSSRKCYLSLLTVALVPPTTLSAERRARNNSLQTRTRRRHSNGPGQHRQLPTSPSRTTKLSEGNSQETLRERWVDILSLEQDSNSVRLENRREQNYYYEAEVLADKLLGLDDDTSLDDGNTSLQDGKQQINSLLTTELSLLWKATAIASSIILIGIPIAALFSHILTSSAMQNMLSSIRKSITPYLVPTLAVVSASVKNLFLQSEAIWHSLPYLLKHMNRIRIRPLPFLYKLIRKCIILEAWRHVWVRIYKLSRYLWKGTLKNTQKAYFRLCPAWIRRGIKSTFQSMVQAQVHGVVGGVLGSVLSGVTFESWVWSGSSGSDTASSAADTMQESVVNDAMTESLTQNAAQGLKNAIHETIIDSASMEDTVEAITDSASSAVEDAVEMIAEETMDAAMDAIAEETIDATMDAIAESAEDVVEIIAEDKMEAIVESAVESVESSLEDVVESLVDDCLTEGCLDQVVESVME